MIYEGNAYLLQLFLNCDSIIHLELKSCWLMMQRVLIYRQCFWWIHLFGKILHFLEIRIFKLIRSCQSTTQFHLEPNYLKQLYNKTTIYLSSQLFALLMLFALVFFSIDMELPIFYVNCFWMSSTYCDCWMYCLIFILGVFTIMWNMKNDGRDCRWYIH